MESGHASRTSKGFGIAIHSLSFPSKPSPHLPQSHPNAFVGSNLQPARDKVRTLLNSVQTNTAKQPPETPPPLRVHIGTAGWSIPRQEAARVPGEGSHLHRYSAAFTCTEINSTFYRPHRASTYTRWAASTPEDFRFSVKVPRSITHETALRPAREQLQDFVDQIGHLGSKLGPILLQLPPRQSFDEPVARDFLSLFRDIFPSGSAALEPRHSSWFSPDAEKLLTDLCISRVIADPPITAEAHHVADDRGLTYYRLHGSPRVYYSSYSNASLQEIAEAIFQQKPREAWCIFDNTASGAALGNALGLAQILPR